MKPWPKHMKAGWHTIRVREDESPRAAIKRYFRASSVVLFDGFATVDGLDRYFDADSEAILDALEDAEQGANCYIPETFTLRIQV